MRIYVGNLNFQTTEDALRGLFEEHGTVEEVFVPTDRQSGRPRGFAFVTMPDAEQANKAIEAFNGQEVEGRTLTVNEAKPKPAGSGGGRGGYGGGRRERGDGGERW